MILRPFILVIATISLLLAGCDDAIVDDEPEPIEAVLVENLPADPMTSVDPETGRPVGTGEFTFFSLRENRIVPRADSATAEWDLAFRTTGILTNGGTSGPGDGGALIINLPFEEVREAPADSELRVDAEGDPAIPGIPGVGWYNYNQQTHIITPIPGRTIVVRTADGRYAKLRILSYYKDAPEEIGDAEPRYYTFEYVFQPDGSRTFGSD